MASDNIARLPHPSDAAIGCAVRSWEPEINDLHDAADVTTEIVGDSLHMNGEIKLTEDQVRRILFCTFDVLKRAERLKETYYAALGG